MKNVAVPKDGIDKRRKRRTPGAERGSADIHRLIGRAVLQVPCPQFPAFIMPLAFSTYVRMMMCGRTSAPLCHLSRASLWLLFAFTVFPGKWLIWPEMDYKPWYPSERFCCQEYVQLKRVGRPTERSLNKEFVFLNRKQRGSWCSCPMMSLGTQALSPCAQCFLGQASSSCLSPHARRWHSGYISRPHDCRKKNEWWRNALFLRLNFLSKDFFYLPYGILPVFY